MISCTGHDKSSRSCVPLHHTRFFLVRNLLFFRWQQQNLRMSPLHLLIVLASCVAAVYIRLQAVFNYGRVIHEFDPWFNFRATQYLVDHGYKAFSTWFDDRSWCVPCARGHLRCASSPHRCQTDILRVYVHSYCMQQARARGGGFDGEAQLRGALSF